MLSVMLGAIVPSAVHSEELQITDYLGLIRAQRSINGKVTVRITTLRSVRNAFDDGANRPVLTQRTGFAGDIEAVESRTDEYLFNGVSAGVWRIRMRNRALLLDKVEILDSSAITAEGESDQGIRTMPVIEKNTPDSTR